LARLRLAAAADKDSVAPEALLAQLCLNAKDQASAKKWMVAALLAAPRDLSTHLAVGRLALDMGQLDEAQRCAVAAMEIQPKSSRAQFFRGLVALLQRDYSTAESHFESAVRQSVGNPAVSNNLALALIQQDDETKKRRALEYAEANAQKYPDSVEASATYGWVLYKLGRAADAEKALHAVAAAPNPAPDTAYILARMAADGGRNSEARQLLEGALKNIRPFMFQREARELLERLKR
jgi:cellulose synthase operon protein C